MRHQPKALIIFFLTEMWERFGFYIVEGLLILYMTHALSFSDGHAYQVLGEFSAFAYISPILGGWIADNVLGFRFSIFLGAIILFFGYFSLVFNGHFLFVGLALIVVGNGLLKPNISSFLGHFYETDDSRRDAGFTIFYMGINLGVFFATTSIGFIQAHLGWYTTFATAACGMLIGIVIFRYGYRFFENKGFPEDIVGKTTFLQYLFKKPLLILSLILGVLAAYALMLFADFTNGLLIVVGSLLLIYLCYIAFKLNRVERNRMLACIILIAISIVYWAVYMEVFFAVNLFTDRVVDRTIFGITVPPIAFISLETLFILLLGPLFARLWQHLSEAAHDFSTSLKFALALLFIGFAMQLLTVAIHSTSLGHLLSPLWMVGFYFILTISEMLLSPIGLAMITDLSPPHYVGMMMGVWFMSTGFGSLLSGVLAQGANIPEGVHKISELSTIYGNTFQHFALLCFAGFAVALIFVPFINRLVRTTD
ncbi:MAG: peptide MFS transporter [Gammaproteobacteria bacterium]